ncbi:hypothetical protein O6P43_000353 [Quillaja saponaria]|uniref:Uncharacterized protein n=1 Tax=Quillaja saponaria TaxID=32244 RepID=A0AAD7QGC6_QUISA|nr:hypothetical protein O6P43_000353 [Quillaja saponaria]
MFISQRLFWPIDLYQKANATMTLMLGPTYVPEEGPHLLRQDRHQPETVNHPELYFVRERKPLNLDARHQFRSPRQPLSLSMTSVRMEMVDLNPSVMRSAMRIRSGWWLYPPVV